MLLLPHQLPATGQHMEDGKLKPAFLRALSLKDGAGIYCMALFQSKPYRNRRMNFKCLHSNFALQCRGGCKEKPNMKVMITK